MKLLSVLSKTSDSDYAKFNIEGGDNCECIGDQVYFSVCGTWMEVSCSADADVIHEMIELFENKGDTYNAMTACGII